MAPLCVKGGIPGWIVCAGPAVMEGAGNGQGNGLSFLA
jgi:hypothetical protein